MKAPLKLSCLLAAAAAQAGWFPDSPLLQVGDDLDIYFTAKARVDYESNIFFGSPGGLPNSGTSWTIGPGFTADFAKEANFSTSINWRRDFVRYFNSKLKSLDDERDIGGASFTYDGGGPLTFQLTAAYSETARNTAETNAILGPSAPGTLVSQTGYSQSATLGYRFTDKISASLSATHSSNRYDPVLITAATAGPPATPDIFNTDGLVESDGWSFPLNIRYQVRERLNIGLAYEHSNSDLRQARGSSAPLLTGTKFTKDFYGITLSGQPTTSGKLDATLRVGLLRSSFDGGSDAQTSGSYSVSLTHTLTEKLNHSLTLSDDANVAINGARSRGRSGNYVINYVMNEGFRASAFVGITSSAIEPSTTIRSRSFGVNATYSPDSHWSYVAGYNINQVYHPSSYNVQQFSLEANLRW